MKLHSTRNAMHASHTQQPQPQFAGRMQPSQYVEAPPPPLPFACRTRKNEELWHDQYHHQPDLLPDGIRIPSTQFDSHSLMGHPQEIYTDGGGGSYELHHREQEGSRRRPEQGVSRFQKPSRQADISSQYGDREYQCDISGRFSSMQHPHPVDAYFLDSDLSGIPQRGAPLEDFDIEPPARQLFRSQSETHSRHSSYSFPEHHSGISASSRTNNVGQIFGIPDRRRPKVDGPFSQQAAHATRFQDPMDPPNHAYGRDDQDHEHGGIYAQAPDMSRRPSDFQDNFPTSYVATG
jgi:hypothetical protein